MKKATHTLAVIALLTITVFGGLQLFKELNTNSQKTKTQRNTAELEPRLKNNLENQGGSWSIAVLDLRSGEEVNINAKKSLHAASLTKLITASTALRRVEKRELSLQTTTNGASVKEHIFKMINQSDNDSWHVLNDLAGWDNMQETAVSLGMKNTSIYENTTTADDTALFLKKLYREEILNEKHTNLLLSYMKNTETENRIPAGIEDGITVLHKAGALNGYFHDASIVKRTNPYILVIMGEQVPSTQEGTATMVGITKIVDSFLRG